MMDDVKITHMTIFNSIPLMEFMYMHQDAIPQIHHELTDTSVAKMSKVLYIGTAISGVFYTLNGLFGAITWAKFHDKIAVMEG